MSFKTYRSNHTAVKHLPGMSRMGRLGSSSSATQRVNRSARPLANVAALWGRLLVRVRHKLSSAPQNPTATLRGQGLKMPTSPLDREDLITNNKEKRRFFMITSNYMSITALTLVALGAINWGLVGLLDFNLVSYVFGPYTPLSKFVYTLVGIAGVYMVYNYKRFVL
jgi:uncharacterized membrane protein YuzA (DUF378 family)